MTEVGRLDAAARHLPTPQLLVRVATRLEAVGTSALEGTYAKLDELFAAEVEPSTDNVASRVREVLNYISAVEHGYDWVSERPVSKTLLSELQATLVRGTESDGPSAGSVRTEQVFIGPKHRPISEARFVPPPPGPQLETMYDAWFDWVREDRNPPQIHLLVRLAMAHYQFETIHPYHDGNGRVGRLAVVLQLMREDVLRQPILSISPWLKEREDEYKDHLLAVSRTGQWDPWVSFFSAAVSSEAKRTQERFDNLLSLQRELSDRARALMPRGRLAIDIADKLIGFPVVTVSWVEQTFGKSNQASRNAVDRLIEHGLIEPYDDARYDRRYWNPTVFQTLAR